MASHIRYGKVVGAASDQPTEAISVEKWVVWAVYMPSSVRTSAEKAELLSDGSGMTASLSPRLIKDSLPLARALYIYLFLRLYLFLFSLTRSLSLNLPLETAGYEGMFSIHEQLLRRTVKRF